MTAKLLLALIETALNSSDASHAQLLSLLAAVTAEADRALGHYWIWKLSLEAAIDHRLEAIRLFAELYSRIPRHDYKLKLDELRAAAAATTSSTTPSEVSDAVTE
jgi:hypothetical protein